MTPFPASPESLSAEQEATIAATVAALDQAKLTLRIDQGRRLERAHLIANPSEALTTLQAALTELGASDDTQLLMRRLAESVADDIAQASKPPVAFSLRAYREERG